MSTYLIGSARLWATTTDYLDFKHTEVGRIDSNPNKTFLTQFGLPIVQTPVDSAAKKQWAIRITQQFYASHIHRLNSLSDRNAGDWLEYYIRDAVVSSYTLLVWRKGHQVGGAAVSDKKYYTVSLSGSLPEWIGGLRNGLGGLPQKKLQLLWDATDEGTFYDWDFGATAAYAISSATAATDRFTIAGDHSARFTVGVAFAVTGSTSGTNDSPSYSCLSSTYSSTTNLTTIQVTTVPANDTTGLITVSNLRTRGTRPV